MGCPVNYNLKECSSNEYGLTCDTCVNKKIISAPRDLIELLDKLSDDNYILLCHSSKVNEVKSWKLPYKVIGNNWLDMTVKDKDKIYVIPDYKNKPISVIYK